MTAKGLATPHARPSYRWETRYALRWRLADGVLVLFFLVGLALGAYATYLVARYGMAELGLLMWLLGPLVALVPCGFTAAALFQSRFALRFRSGGEVEIREGLGRTTVRREELRCERGVTSSRDLFRGALGPSWQAGLASLTDSGPLVLPGLIVLRLAALLASDAPRPIYRLVAGERAWVVFPPHFTHAAALELQLDTLPRVEAPEPAM